MARMVGAAAGGCRSARHTSSRLRRLPIRDTHPVKACPTGPSSRKESLKKSLLMLPFVLLAAALALSACGGGGSSTSGSGDESAIEAAIESDATSAPSPSKCTELETVKLQRTEAGHVRRARRPKPAKKKPKKGTGRIGRRLRRQVKANRRPPGRRSRAAPSTARRSNSKWRRKAATGSSTSSLELHQVRRQGARRSPRKGTRKDRRIRSRGRSSASAKGSPNSPRPKPKNVAFESNVAPLEELFEADESASCVARWRPPRRRRSPPPSAAPPRSRCSQR